MKIRWILLCCLAGLGASFVGGASGGAKSGISTAPAQTPIGVVKMLEILQERAKDSQHLQEIMAERAKARAELETLLKEVEAEEDDLKTLKPGSDDYLKQMEQVLEKKGRYEGRKEFFDRRLALGQQIWTQKLYSDIIRITGEIAEEKGLCLVLTADQRDLPLSEGIASVIATQKVLYSGGCTDITEEVKTRLTAAKP